MARVICACGSGVATSQLVASKVTRMLKDRGVDADVEAVDIKSLRHYINGADAYVSIVKGESFDIPTFDGIKFLMVSIRLVNCVASTLLSTISIDTPFPRPSALGKNNPSKLAITVVAT